MSGQAVVAGLGQGTKADYKRAAEIRDRFSGKVYKEKIHPHWIGGNNFWYETSVRGKREYMLVHGTNGKRRLLHKFTSIHLFYHDSFLIKIMHFIL